MNTKKVITGLLAGVAMLALLGAVTVAAFAQSDDDSGPNWAGPRRMGGPGGGILFEYMDHEGLRAELAEVLGLSPAELEAAREDGTGLFELAEERGVELEDLRAIHDEYFQAAIDSALADGAIDADQAEWLRERRGPAYGRGPGGRPGCRGGQQFGPHQNGSFNG